MRKMAFSLCLALVAMGTAAPIDGQILHPWVLVTTKRLSAYRRFTHDLATGLAHEGAVPADIIYPAKKTPIAFGDETKRVLEEARLLVVVGPDNLARVLHLHLRVPTLAIYVTHHAFQRLTEHASPTAQVTAIYLNQPLTRFLSLARVLIPRLHAISTVLSKNQGWRKPGIQRVSSSLGYAAHIIIVPNRLHAIFSAFRFVLPGTDVLIEFPDATIYNAVTLPTILLRTIRYGVPIISYAPAYVQAGALAAVYSTPAEFAKQTLYILAGLKNPHFFLPKPTYPAQFRLLLNPDVADTLGIALPQTSEILKRMHKPVLASRSNPRV
ncbi:MAG: hypothetical protein ACYCS1_06805 [Gammaproteobacteria bacterium]